MSEHYEALGLEASCVEPGHWLIEGYDVLRFHSDFSSRPVWVIRRHGRTVAATDRLRDAWQWVGQAVNGGGSR
ncbi:hypothetical protein [Kribbella solani]|uniref:Uncharacterized protein n=1 Tax=Kribbella solani TaxID=236067 RepID=A0A841DXL5_9ACTN|nr:hypothetical protein [Kribbella solani]MBB5981510.1 hypothetical protein [Kribbella solani]